MRNAQKKIFKIVIYIALASLIFTALAPFISSYT